tara:strand:+ start:318829 stop:319209 length:381 start_codon:yes stop_codon:yes gene_type:complete
VPASIATIFVVPFRSARNFTRAMFALQNRERIRLWNEMTQMRGLIPLLMKQRNGYRWTDLDRKRIKVQLRKLVELSPYLVLFVAPGGLLVLPVLIWWLDRRQIRPEVEGIEVEIGSEDATSKQLLP